MTTTTDPLTRQRVLSDASRRYVRHEISRDQYQAIQEQNNPNYGAALLELAIRRADAVQREKSELTALVAS